MRRNTHATTAPATSAASTMRIVDAAPLVGASSSRRTAPVSSASGSTCSTSTFEAPSSPRPFSLLSFKTSLNRDMRRLRSSIPTHVYASS